MSFIKKLLLPLFLLLAVAAASYASFAYHLPARASKAVELTVRYSDLQIFAARAGLTVEEALLFFKEQGITSIGVAEHTLWQLRRDPGSYVLSNLELAGELALNPALSPYRDFLETKVREAGFSFGDYLVFMPAGDWAEQVGEHLHALYAVEGGELFHLTMHRQGEMVLYLLQGVQYDHLPPLSLGVEPARLEQVAAAGLLINPYLSPRTVETAGMAEQMLAVYGRYPLSAAVFEGGVIPGYPHTLPELAAAMRARGIPAALYEYHLFPQGMKDLAPLLAYKLVVMRPGSILDEPRAAISGLRERRVQLLELELRELAAQRSGLALQEAVAARLARLTAALQENGYTPGQALPLQPFKGHFLLYLLMAAGVLSMVLYLLQFFWPLQPALLTGLFAGGLVALAFFLKVHFLFTQQALALLAAVAFPYYGALYLLTRPFAAAANPGLPVAVCNQPPGAEREINRQSELDMYNRNGSQNGVGEPNEADDRNEAGNPEGADVHNALNKRNETDDCGKAVNSNGENNRSKAAGHNQTSDREGADGYSGAGKHSFFHPGPGLLWTSLFRVFILFLLSLAGGLLVHGLLTTPPFFHGLEFFRGVKVMYILPLALSGLTALVFVASFSNHKKRSFSACRGSLFPLQLSLEQRQTFLATLHRLLRRPLTLGNLLFFGLLLCGVYFLLTRSGHVRTIISLEGNLRNLLDQTLGVRPRFKEFILGYPLALFGLYLATALFGRSKAAYPAIFSGKGGVDGASEPRFPLAGHTDMRENLSCANPNLSPGAREHRPLELTPANAHESANLSPGAREHRPLELTPANAHESANLSPGVREHRPLELTPANAHESANLSPGAREHRPSKTLLYLAFSALLGGVLAPISVVNTFAHTLAPLSLSLLRCFHGFWLGCLAGVLLILCVSRGR